MYCKDSKILYNAFKKYGVKNFTFEVIDYGKNYNELEKYYIEYYNSINNGYNISPGGENPPLKIGENNFYAKHTLEQINKLKNELKNTDKSFKELAIEYKYKDDCTIKRINKGELWKDKDSKYPLRDVSNEELIDNIIYLLKNTTLTQKEIAKQLGLKRSTITMTNIGEHNRRNNEVYPIRNNTKSIIKRDEKFYNQLINYIILHPHESLLLISKKFDISHSTVCNINNGKYHRNEIYNYPLNNNII